MGNTMVKIILLPEKQVLDISEKKNLKNELEAKGIAIRSSCGGFGTCGECIVTIAKGMDQCSPPTYQEIKLLGNIFHLTNERLSCQLKVQGNIELDLSKQRTLQKTNNKTFKKKVSPKPLRRKPPEKKEEEAPVVVEVSSTPLKKHEQDKGKQGGFQRPKRKP